MKVKKSVLIGVFAVLALFTSLGQSAYAHGKHGSNSPHFKMKKNMGPFGEEIPGTEKATGAVWLLPQYVDRKNRVRKAQTVAQDFDRSGDVL